MILRGSGRENLGICKMRKFFEHNAVFTAERSIHPGKHLSVIRFLLRKQLLKQGFIHRTILETTFFEHGHRNARDRLDASSYNLSLERIQTLVVPIR